ncbi:MAG: nitrilase [Paracoccus denitrificans]|uniref:Nitrilase n=1 Tax=Paracoccus denitrificans TaxID=266 RepID=A0A533HZD8_PARDE|nr:MAG: nitrilase [Paracoccus denitrificans]
MAAENGLVMALWQGESVAGDADHAFTRIAQATGAAGMAGADVITFPELMTSGYNRDDLTDHAMTMAELAGRLAPIARDAGCAIVTGYPERLDHGVANAAICVAADGTVLANHRKIQLFGPDEARKFRPGDAYTSFMLCGRRAAMLICYDVEFAPHVAALKGQGVEMILVPTANMHPFAHIGQHVIPAMAANHALSIVYANYCGAEGDLSYFGGSSITSADGHVLARAGDAPCLLISHLPAHPDPATLSTQLRDLRQIAG